MREYTLTIELPDGERWRLGEDSDLEGLGVELEAIEPGSWELSGSAVALRALASDVGWIGMKDLARTIRAALEGQESEVRICGGCDGSGEGRYDGSTCYSCKGTGEES